MEPSVLAICLAGTAVGANQAFSFGPAAPALQFHLELAPNLIER